MNERNLDAMRLLVTEMHGCTMQGCSACHEQASFLVGRGVVVPSALTDVDTAIVTSCARADDGCYLPDQFRSWLAFIARGAP